MRRRVIVACFLLSTGGATAFAKGAKKARTPKLATPPAPAAEDDADAASDATPEADADVVAETSLVAEDPRPWRAGLYAGAPEGVAVQLGRQLAPKWSVRAFVAPPLTLNVPLTIPQQTVASGTTYDLVTEATTFDMHVSYGPQLGVDAQFFPWAKRFFVSTGLAYRRITVTAEDDPQLLLCPANSTSCTAVGGAGADANQARLSVKGSATTTSGLARLGVGWQWLVGERGYVALDGLGIAYPFAVQRKVDTEAEVTSNFTPLVRAVVEAATRKMIDREEDALEDEIAQEIAPYDTSPLPLIGVTAGVRF